MPDINILTPLPTLPTLPTEIVYNILSHHIEQSYIDCLTSPSPSPPLASSTSTSSSICTQVTNNVDIYNEKKILTNIPLFAYTTLRLARTSTLFLFELLGLLDPISAHVHERWIEATKALQKVRAMWYMRAWDSISDESDRINNSRVDNESNDNDGNDMGEQRRLSLKEKERLLEAQVEGYWRDVCVIAGLGAKMRALRVCVTGRWEREDRLRVRKMKMEME